MGESLIVYFTYNNDILIFKYLQRKKYVDIKKYLLISELHIKFRVAVFNMMKKININF